MLLPSLRDIVAKLNVVSKLNEINMKQSEKQQTEIASVKAFGVETAEKADVNEEVLDYVMGEALPEQDFKNEELESTIDYILTEVIPPLMGNE